MSPNPEQLSINTHRITDVSAEAQRLVLSGAEVEDRPVMTVGSKAARLAALPQAWVPPFAVLTDAFSEKWRAHRGAGPVLAALSAEDNRTLETVLRFQQASTLSEEPALFVRSSSIDETLATSHGRYDSKSIPPTTDSLAAAVDSVMTAAPFEMRIIVQVAIDGVNGRMSNERRVSRVHSISLVEGFATQGRNTVRRSTRPPADGPLYAGNVADVKRRLAELMGWLVDRGATYFTAEWVWDGERVWVVQWEPVENEESPSWVTEYLDAKSVASGYRAALIDEPIIWARAGRDDAARWRKLSKSATLSDLNIPTPPLLVRQIGIGDGLNDLAAAEELVAIGPPGTLWVIRTDIDGHAQGQELLPTSAPLDTADRLASFMAEARASMKLSGVQDHRWAFLATPLISARASAMAYGVPNSPSTQVDSLWGFPDGLLYLPHDKALVPVNAADTITSFAEYKPACLLFSGVGWEYVPLANPHDYQQVLRDDELRTAAHWAKTLAERVGAGAQLMIMCRVDGVRGPAGMCAFHYSVEEIVRPKKGAVDVDSQRAITVQDVSGLERAMLLPAESYSALRLRPNRPLRDQEFLRRLGEFAAKAGKPILFYGSLLGHAYHILSSFGALVCPADAAELGGPSTRYSKLVRDRIPAIIEESGSVARVRTLTSSEAAIVLRQKLVEEALEAFAAPPDQLLAELADILEVVHALADQIGGMDQVERMRLEKRARAGGFEDLVFLEFTRPALVDIPIDPGNLPVNLADRPAEATRRARVTEESGQLVVEFDLPLVPSISTISMDAATPDGHEMIRIAVAYDVPRAQVKLKFEPTRDRVAAEQEPLF